MSQNTNQIILEKLQRFIIDNLIKNCYQEDDENFQANQFQAVCDTIQQLCDEYSPETLDSLLNTWEKPIVPLIHDVGGHAHMQNIGTSAFKCLQKMQEPPKSISRDIMSCVQKFLARVQQEAQNASEAYVEEAKKHRAPSDVALLSRDLSVQTFFPFLQEYNTLLVQKRTAFETFYSTAKQDLEQLAKETKDELEQISSIAKASAAEAEKNAQEAKSTVTEILHKLDKATVAADNATIATNNATTASEKATTATENATTAANEATTAAKEATTSAEKAITAATNAEETSKNMLPNMLSALGIFIGIVVAVMACYLSILLAQNGENTADIARYSRPFEFMQYLLMGHITLAVVFLLMFLISRISGHSLACSCRHFASGNPNCTDCDCWVCKNKCSIPVRFKLRYPYLYGINLVCFLGYAILAFWQFINLYYREQVNVWILANRGCAIIVLLIAFGILVFILFKIFRFQGEKNKKST